MGTIDSREQFEEVKAARDAAGIVCAACHAGYGNLLDPAKVEAYVKFTQAIGSGFLITSGSHQWKTLDAYVEGAKVLNAVGRQCRDAGLRFLYHNHAWEFRPIEGQAPIHTMIAALDSELVQLCPDIYWVQVGGMQPADFISGYRDLIPFYHFKDGFGGDQFREFRELGQGNVDISVALKAALATDPAWIVIEQDRSSLEPGESARVSREYLKSLGV
jgi:sugar phosphate isomerase/epimerase